MRERWSISSSSPADFSRFVDTNDICDLESADGAGSDVLATF